MRSYLPLLVFLSVAAAFAVEAAFGGWIALAVALAATGVTVLALVVEPRRGDRRPW